MRQRLREVPRQVLANYVVFLRPEVDVVAHREDAFELRAGFGMTALHGEAVRHPTGTGEEGALVRVARMRFLAADQAAFGQFALNHVDG